MSIFFLVATATLAIGFVDFWYCMILQEQMDELEEQMHLIWRKVWSELTVRLVIAEKRIEILERLAPGVMDAESTDSEGSESPSLLGHAFSHQVRQVQD